MAFIWSIIVTELAFALVYDFSVGIDGESFTVLSQCLIFSQEDTIGDEIPYISIENKEMISEEDFFYILNSTEFEKAQSEDLCFGSGFPRSSGDMIYRINIASTDVYTIVNSRCSNRTSSEHFAIEYRNPFGYIQGELFMLLPFYLAMSTIYTIILCVWLVKVNYVTEHSTRIQKEFISWMLLTCACECLISYADWYVVNEYGYRLVWVFLAAVLIKALRDTFVRVLLLGASAGWEITQSLENSPKRTTIIIGGFYLVFDCLYELCIRTMNLFGQWMNLIVSLPLVVMNVIILYRIFASLSNVLLILNHQKKVYKTNLFQSFGTVLGVTACVYFVWAVVENVLKFIYTRKTIWEFSWLFVAVWEVIFLLVVLSMLFVWRVNKHSQMLAFSYQITDDDENLSDDEKAIEMD